MKGESTMGKNTMNYFSKVYLAMGIISSAMIASEDGKITAAEMIQVISSALLGMGLVGVDLKGLAVVPNEDGSVDLHFPANLVDKLHISV
jgi:hypothetical protein